MVELSKNFEPAPAELKWTKEWKEKGYFNSTPDERKAYTVVIPPPNVTGVLHMGHTLNETVQDILVRNARMRGFNACWVPGSDHASIATESKVVQMLKEQGIDKNSLTREEFLKYAFEWKEKYGGIIYNQIERLGCSVDWNRVTFTMDDHYYKAVIRVFVDLYNKGLIYRGARMIHWDPAAQTALSDEEVEYKDLTGTLYYLSYPVETADGKTESITIATQRPETIMGDTAICVNPADTRYAHLQGAFATVPLIDRRIPIIFDEYVDLEFGTGALKVTPAHDINDYNLGLKHKLEVVDTLNADGTMSEAAQIYIGEDRFKARKQIVEELREKGFLLKEDFYPTRLGYSQRSGAVVEPRISTQWFVKMKDLALPALEAVTDGSIRIHPGDKFLATYKYWMENVKDWCISRQLWWGQQIPAWYDDAGNMVVAENEYDALQQMQATYGTVTASTGKITRDEDVLDTWFSSWLWPMEVFNGISEPGNQELAYYYPTSVLVTGQDIIFFWVARMVMAGMQYEKVKPFSDVYFTGMVRDKQGRKMSKSLGNSPDLLDLINRYGADAVRFGIMISSPAGNDLLFDESSLEQGRNFNNKLWNALKLVRLWENRKPVAPGFETNSAEQLAAAAIIAPVPTFAVEWFASRLNEVRVQVEQLISQFRLSEALKTIYSLIWDDFCSWYLEWVKPGFEQPADPKILKKTIGFFTELMHLLHPFMPFITEEIYHSLEERSDDLCVRQYIIPGSADQAIIADGEMLKKLITALREMRIKNNLKQKEGISIFVQTAAPERYKSFESIFAKQVNALAIELVSSFDGTGISLAVDQDRLFIQSSQPVDTTAQKEALMKDLEHQQKFLDSVTNKLANEKFVANAKPEVLGMEQKKQADAAARIRAIEESLQSLA